MDTNILNILKVRLVYIVDRTPIRTLYTHVHSHLGMVYYSQSTYFFWKETRDELKDIAECVYGSLGRLIKYV